jgi:MFS family permease
MAEAIGTKRNGYPTMVLLLLASIAVMVMYVEAMSFPSLLKIMQDFDMPASDYALASWIVTIYLIIGAVSIPIFGKLGDIYGKKKMLVIAMVVYSIAVTITGFSRDISDSIYVMIGFRAFQGIGMSMFPLAFSIIRDEFPADKVPVAQGVISAMFGVGTAVGFVVGGFVTDSFGWQWTYHSVAPIAFIFTFVVAMKIRESPIRLKAKVDVIGGALLGATLITILVGITETRNSSWTDPFILTLFALSAILLASFIFWQTKAKDPLIRLSLMKSRDIALSNFIGFLIGFALFTAFQTVAALAGYNFGLDATHIGLLSLPSSVAALVLGPTVGLLVKKRGPKWPLVAGMLISICGFVSLYLFHGGQTDVAIGVLIMGAGNAFAMVSIINMIILSTPREETGISTSVNTIMRVVGSVVGPALAATIISANSTLIPGVAAPVPNDEAYHMIFLLSIVLMAVGVIAGLFLTNKKIPRTESE